MSFLFNQFFDNFLYLILYVTNGASFPKPLSEAEEKYYIEKMASGDKKAKDVLIERNLRLVAHIIKKYYSSNKDQDDLISVGTIGLIKGISSFDAGKGIRLATYAARCIENEILMYFRSQKKLSNEVFISDPVDTDKDGNSLTFMDIVYDSADILDDIDLKINISKLYKYVESLPAREKMILSMRYGLYGTKPETQKVISKKLDISRSYVSRIEKKAIAELKAMFETK